MPDWDHGYISSLPYTTLFHKELAPAYLKFAVTQAGLRSNAIEPDIAYCELGCGQGVGTALLAASNPHQLFWGVDFNPAHIVYANQLVTDGRLNNVQFLSASFDELLEETYKGLPDFDVVALHGVYSWISAPMKQAILKFLYRKLKPGGLCYVSYNCSPGWAHRAPLIRLLREHGRRHGGSHADRLRDGLQLSDELASAKAWYFFETPSVQAYVDRLKTADTNYAVHELMQQFWDAPFHADIAADMATAKLSFACSATLVEDLLEVSVLSPVIRDKIKREADSVWRETLKDFTTPKAFRKDIFIKGAVPLSEKEKVAELDKLTFALTVPASRVNLEFKVPVGLMPGRQDIYGPVIEALDGKALSFNAILGAVGRHDINAAVLRTCLLLLIHSGQARPGLNRDMDPSPSRRLNDSLIASLDLDGPTRFAATPVIASAIPVSFSETAVLWALKAGLTLDPDVIMNAIRHEASPPGLAAGAPLEDQSALRHQIQAAIDKVPVFKTLGIDFDSMAGERPHRKG